MASSFELESKKTSTESGSTSAQSVQKKNEKEKDKDTSVIRQQSKLLTGLEIFMFYVMY